ncbi:hypothetical protein [Haloimpatiens lingqiaonensis]|uniref:hypothetical protein n=2 Tax=Haloimpatiens lingqiaonensis TaxID=1380675 RepID=UPI0037BF6ED4
MLQLIKREFDSLEKLIQYINSISINYEYLKDYDLLKEDNEYIAIMKFDVPTISQYLELARLKKQNSEEKDSAYRIYYYIELEDGSQDKLLPISFNDIDADLSIQAFHELYDIYNLIKINYSLLEHYFIIKLYNFKYNYSDCFWYTELSETILSKTIDYKIIYNHLVKLILDRGYLLNLFSLNNLKESVYYKVRGLNRKHSI